MMKAITIVGFGDSITEAAVNMPDTGLRWLNRLERKLNALAPENCRFQVFNAGVGGNSAREAMARMETDVLRHDPDWVLLEFGGNNNDPAHPERVVPPAEFKLHLAHFRALLPAKTRVIVITFPPIFPEQHIYWQNPAYRPYLEQTQATMGIDCYIEITRQFAAENHYPLFDLNRVLVELGKSHGHDRYTLPDGVHLTAAGNAVLADGMLALLRDQRNAAVEQR